MTWKSKTFCNQYYSVSSNQKNLQNQSFILPSFRSIFGRYFVDILSTFPAYGNLETSDDHFVILIALTTCLWCHPTYGLSAELFDFLALFLVIRHPVFCRYFSGLFFWGSTRIFSEVLVTFPLLLTIVKWINYLCWHLDLFGPKIKVYIRVKSCKGEVCFSLAG